mmetsp:Transcript_37522/g.87512  ORF Transcript_37522/g.87512 Transcript_37522/m.87512 type:complete len:333 (+) Transcript_37522:845-1843(+)
MAAVGVGGAGVAVEQRRQHALGQRGREEAGMAVQRLQHQGLQRAELLAILFGDGLQLLVVLDLGGLGAGAAAAIGPGCGVQQCAGTGDAGGIEDLGDLHQHGVASCRRSELVGAGQRDDAALARNVMAGVERVGVALVGHIVDVESEQQRVLDDRVLGHQVGDDELGRIKAGVAVGLLAAACVQAAAQAPLRADPVGRPQAAGVARRQRRPAALQLAAGGRRDVDGGHRHPGEAAVDLPGVGDAAGDVDVQACGVALAGQGHDIGVERVGVALLQLGRAEDAEARRQLAVGAVVLAAELDVDRLLRRDAGIGGAQRIGVARGVERGRAHQMQ